MDLSIIQSKIRIIRGRKVLLDFDLAGMYETTTKRLKEQVRRNIGRFAGEDFMFELSKYEITELSRSHFATLNKGRGSNIKYAPFAFTELGVAMLSSVLESDKAIEVNRDIMRVFVIVRQFHSDLSELNQRLEDFMVETNIQFSEIYQALIELAEQKKELDKPRNPIGYLSGKK
jgi:hypothetical protein